MVPLETAQDKPSGQRYRAFYQVTLTTDAHGHQTVNAQTNPQPLLNDFMVTVTSAKYTGFNELRFWKKDHTTIGDSEVLSALLASGTVSLALERSFRQ